MDKNERIKWAEAAYNFRKQMLLDSNGIFNAKCPNRDELIVLGQRLWSLSYAKTDDDKEAFGHLFDFFSSLEGTQRDLAMSHIMIPNDQIMILGAARWFDQGLPQIVMDHKFCAALAATSVSKESKEFIRAPWKAFVIMLPDNLFDTYDFEQKKRSKFTHVLVHNTLIENISSWHYVAFTEDGCILWSHGASLNRMIEGDINPEDNSWKNSIFQQHLDKEDDRMSVIMWRLVIGSCLAMSNPENVRKIGKSHQKYESVIKRGRKEPIVRIFKLGREIKIDCRTAVQDFIHGKINKSPSVQILVRGHWKTQPHGPQSSLRKLIWREPYWRGPEDAPILHRPVRIDD
jgi:hypothetical protein